MASDTLFVSTLEEFKANLRNFYEKSQQQWSSDMSGELQRMKQICQQHQQQWSLERKELERQLSKMSWELQRTNHDLQQYKQHWEKIEKTLVTLNENNKMLDSREKDLKYREKEIALCEERLKKTTRADISLPILPQSRSTSKIVRSSSLDFSMRDDSSIQLRNGKVYGEIRPGSITHEDVQRQFTEYFLKYRRSYGSTLTEYNKQKGTIPCQVLQIAFDESKEKVLTLVTKTLETGKRKHVVQAKKLLQRCHMSTSHNPESQELRNLFIKPIGQRDIGGNPEGWEEKKHAFTLLLNCTDIFSDGIVKALKEKILKENITDVENADLIDMVDRAVPLVWDMVTLVPPAIVYQPLEYHDEWQERRFTCWKEENAGKPPLIYYRPVLFFSALGHVGCKGEVGNVSTGSAASSSEQVFKTKTYSPQIKNPLNPITDNHTKKKTAKNPCTNEQLSKSFSMHPSSSTCQQYQGSHEGGSQLC